MIYDCRLPKDGFDKFWTQVVDHGLQNENISKIVLGNTKVSFYYIIPFLFFHKLFWNYL